MLKLKDSKLLIYNYRATSDSLCAKHTKCEVMFGGIIYLRVWPSYSVYKRLGGPGINMFYHVSCFNIKYKIHIKYSRI